jgi:hypothetical protein
MSQPIPVGSAVYVRYRDHILFRNTMNTIDVPVERETIGWLANENADAICIHWDKTLKPFSKMNESPHCGLVLIKNCILEIHALPLQDFLDWSLSCWNTKDSITECAFQTEKRKTQPKDKTGAKR